MSSYFHSAFLTVTRPFRKQTEEEKRQAARQKAKQNTRSARIRNGYTHLTFVTHNHSPTRKMSPIPSRSRSRSRSRGGRRTKHRSRK